MQRLAGRAAVVTGAADGIGRAVAVAMESVASCSNRRSAWDKILGVNLVSAKAVACRSSTISGKGLQSYRFSSSLALFAKVQSVISATEILSWVFRVA